MGTKKAVLKRQAAGYEKNKEWIETKNRRLKLAASLLTIATALTVIGVGLRFL